MVLSFWGIVLKYYGIVPRNWGILPVFWGIALGRISDMHLCDTMFVQWLDDKSMSMSVLFSRVFWPF